MQKKLIIFLLLLPLSMLASDRSTKKDSFLLERLRSKGELLSHETYDVIDQNSSIYRDRALERLVDYYEENGVLFSINQKFQTQTSLVKYKDISQLFVEACAILDCLKVGMIDTRQARWLTLIQTDKDFEALKLGNYVDLLKKIKQVGSVAKDPHADLLIGYEFLNYFIAASNITNKTADAILLKLDRKRKELLNCKQEIQEPKKESNEQVELQTTKSNSCYKPFSMLENQSLVLGE